ncbi:MAG: GNAT family N-acetyltransferase [Dehalococcoidia bacterium]|nr:GNAT family N-acetyltransferase [Dehalococcoidia bacterium]
MQLRDATEADLPAIVAIYNTTIPSRMVTADPDPVSVESKLSWFRAHTPDRRPLWILDEDGTIAAWLSFNDFYGRPAYHPTAEISVYVAEAYRRRGLGRQLLDEAIRRAPDLRLKTLLAIVFAHNEPSLRLLEGAGFQRWGFLPAVAEMDGIEYDDVILGRRV